MEAKETIHVTKLCNMRSLPSIHNIMFIAPFLLEIGVQL